MTHHRAAAHTVRSVLVLTVLLALASAGVTPAHAAIDADAEKDMACMVDGLRREHGLAPHRVANDLTKVARDHAKVMASKGYIHHNPTYTSDVKNWTMVGENVGVGPSVSSVHAALVASPGHRANLLESRMTEIGIGIERSGGRVWIVQVFRRPSGSNSGSVASCTSVAGSTSGSTGTIKVPSGGIPVVGDWNGDGRKTPGTFVDGTWYLSNGLSSGADLKVAFGTKGDTPVVGDWNGNGRYGIGIVRDGRWHLRQTASSGSAHIQFSYGGKKDIPLAGDWNGNGRYGIGIVRNGRWHLRQTPSGGTGQIQFTYGRVTQGDVPLVGDWNGNGRHGVGIVRNGRWHLRQTPSGGTGQIQFTYGRVTQGDIPLVGDWNGNGRDGIGIVRNGSWHLRQRPSGGSAQTTFSY